MNPSSARGLMWPGCWFFAAKRWIVRSKLGRETFRIGRSEQNDLVLEDPGKAVSRNHAEIRYEGGRYVLADLESQNGIWVAGTRVPFVVLDPKIVGERRPVPADARGRAAHRRRFRVAAGWAALDSTDYLSCSSAVKAEPGSIEAVAARRRRPPPPVTAGPKTPGRRPSRRSRRPKAGVRQEAAARAATPTWPLIGGAALVVLVLAIVIVRIARRPPAERRDRSTVVTHDRRCARLIEHGDCAGALTRRDRACACARSRNAEAQTLKTRQRHAIRRRRRREQLPPSR